MITKANENQVAAGVNGTITHLNVNGTIDVPGHIVMVKVNNAARTNIWLETCFGKKLALARPIIIAANDTLQVAICDGQGNPRGKDLLVDFDGIFTEPSAEPSAEPEALASRTPAPAKKTKS